MSHAPLEPMERQPLCCLPLSPPFPLAARHSWGSAEGGQVQEAGMESQVELGYVANSTKVWLKSVLGISESREGRPSVVEAGTGDAAPLLLW